MSLTIIKSTQREEKVWLKASDHKSNQNTSISYENLIFQKLIQKNLHNAAMKSKIILNILHVHALTKNSKSKKKKKNPQPNPFT